MRPAATPLKGKRIVVTRAPEQSGELVRALEALGAEVLLLPLVAFAPPEDWLELDEQLRKLDGFDAILFLSRNAVRYVMERCRVLGVRGEMVSSPQLLIAVVGPATARALEEEGLQANFVAKNHTGESLARELRESLAGRRVLLPRSDRGDRRVAQSLREAGAQLTEVIAYRTTAPAALDSSVLDRIRRAEIDAVVFASPSAFHNLCDSISAEELAVLSARIQFAAIGPTTAQALREAGARVAIEASDSSAAGLAGAIAGHFQVNAQAGKRA